MDIPGVQQLYAQPLADFVAARNALVKELRAAKRRDEATGVAALRKPTSTAWALNQVARQQPEKVDRALAAGAALRAATDAAVGGDGSALRVATQEDRVAVDDLAAAAEAALGRTGLRPQVAATLRAATADDALAGALRNGVLDTDPDVSGFGFGVDPGGPLAPARPAPAKRPQVARRRPHDRSEADDTASVPAPAAAPISKLAVGVAADARAAARRERQARRAELARLEQRAARLAAAAVRAEAAAVQARADADAAAAALAEARAAGDP